MRAGGALGVTVAAGCHPLTPQTWGVVEGSPLSPDSFRYIKKKITLYLVLLSVEFLQHPVKIGTLGYLLMGGAEFM